MIKLIATDLDNTLLDRSGAVPPETVDIVGRAEQIGVPTAVVTGRSYLSAKAVADKIGSDTPVICYNGSLIREAGSGNTIFEAFLDKNIVSGVLAFCRDHGLYAELYHDDSIVVDRLRRDMHNDPDLRFTPYREIGDLRKVSDIPTPKILLAAASEKVPALQAELKAMFAGKAYFAQSESHLIEIMPAGVDKGSALARLAAHMGITCSEVMALGDNTNDAKLLEAAGFAVAVSNSVPSLKEIADYVCDAERSLGFNEAVTKFILKG